MSLIYSVFVDRDYDTHLRDLWLDDGIHPRQWRPQTALEAASSTGGQWSVASESWSFTNIAGHPVRARTVFNVAPRWSTIGEANRELQSFVGDCWITRRRRSC